MNILITLLALSIVIIVIFGSVVIASDRLIPGAKFFAYIAGDGLNIFGPTAKKFRKSSVPGPRINLTKTPAAGAESGPAIPWKAAAQSEPEK